MEAHRKYQILLLGNPLVGRCSIAHCAATGLYSEYYPTKSGTNYCNYLIKIGTQKYPYTLALWYRKFSMFPKVNESLFKKSHAFILIYDITLRRTFEELEDHLKEILQAVSDRPIAIVGNKSDLAGNSPDIVEPHEGLRYSEELSEKLEVSTIFVETSAKTGYNIPYLFRQLTREIIDGGLSIKFNQAFHDDASVMVSNLGWETIISRLMKYRKKHVMQFLDLEYLLGVDVTKEWILQSIPTNTDFDTGKSVLMDLLLKKLENQLVGGGPTFDLDTEKMASTEAAPLVADIFRLRRDEISSIRLRKTETGKISTESLWNTYYGRLIMKTIRYEEEMEVSKIQMIFQKLSETGLHFCIDM